MRGEAGAASEEQYDDSMTDDSEAISMRATAVEAR
jgi:hypothetical protein